MYIHHTVILPLWQPFLPSLFPAAVEVSPFPSHACLILEYAHMQAHKSKCKHVLIYTYKIKKF